LITLVIISQQKEFCQYKNKNKMNLFFEKHRMILRLKYHAMIGYVN